MTGYGCASTIGEELEIQIEIATINKKNLDVYTNLPREWQGLESMVLERVRSTLSRGKVNLNMQITDLRNEGGLSFDSEAVRASLDRLGKLAASCKIDFKPDAETLLRLVTLTDNGRSLPNWESVQTTVEEVLGKALEQLCQMREKEGDHLHKDLLERIEVLRNLQKSIEKESENTVPNYRELLMQRLKQTELDIDLNDERILKEIAFFADRVDNTEEITRLGSHLEQFTTIMAEKDQPIGRKLDFLCQEIHREMNTIGSKANNLEITKMVIECKNELERIREQVQNVE